MEPKFEDAQAAKLAYRVSLQTIIINVLLSAGKLIAGLAAHSGAMLSDAMHSASDVLSTLLVIVGVRMAGKKSDERHEYGHERMECVAAILLSMMLLLTGLGIGAAGLEKILRSAADPIAAPGALALWAAVISIVVKEGMFWYTRAAANRINSGALMADAWHHRSDALSSIGSFAGILGARLGYPILDPIASLIICLFILKVSVDIFKDAIDKMVDKSCSKQVEAQIRSVVCAQPGVCRLDLLHTRMFGNKIYVDLEIAADAAQSLEHAHRIAEAVHRQVEQHFPTVKHCMVHVNPYHAADAD